MSLRPNPSAPVSGSPARTILLVEDTEPVRKMIEGMLFQRGYQVVATPSAEEALQSMESVMVDGFLLDISLPGMDGIDLCRHIRANARYRVAPVIFLTGADEHENLDPAFAAGGDDFITKPFSAELLDVRLRRHFERTEYYNQLVQAQSALRRYVSHELSRVIDSSLSSGKPLEPEARDVSICFTDIRGFTALSEDLDPLTLFSLLNTYLAEQVHQVHTHGGYIDKFGGDGLMAVFEGPDKETRSCLCALDILEHARELPDAPVQTLRQLGIGIHTGRAVVGNLGSKEHQDYTAIGNTVNLAARLCGVAAPLSVVVSDDVRRAVGAHGRLRFVDGRQVPIRGLRHQVTVYDLAQGQPAPVATRD